MMSFFFIVDLKDWFDNDLVLVILFQKMNEKMNFLDCHHDTKHKRRTNVHSLHVKLKK